MYNLWHLIFKEKEENWNQTNEFNCMGKKIRKKLKLINENNVIFNLAVNIEKIFIKLFFKI